MDSDLASDEKLFRSRVYYVSVVHEESADVSSARRWAGSQAFAIRGSASDRKMALSARIRVCQSDYLILKAGEGIVGIVVGV